MVKHRLIMIGKKFFILLLTLTICLVFFEFVIFNYFIHVSNIPSNTFVNGIIKYVPNQEGKIYIDDIIFKYRINDQGWNSIYQKYSIKRNNKYRIIIIGDSYVEGFSVNFDNSLAEQLESLWGKDIVEVYRFGISGAPMSQYLHILREEASNYNPDLVVIVIIHNDFMESFEMVPGRYTSSFLKLKLGEGQNIQELPPVQYKESFWEHISGNLATLRYLRIHFKMLVKNIFGRFLFSDKRLANPAQFQANIDVTNLKEKKAEIIRATDYIFQEFARLHNSNKFQILILMDGDRRGIYQDKDPRELYDSGALILNAIAAKSAIKYGLPFIDLHPIFAEDYRIHKKKFEYNNDNHWNEYGHRLATKAIYQFIADKGCLTNQEDQKRIP